MGKFFRLENFYLSLRYIFFFQKITLPLKAQRVAAHRTNRGRMTIFTLSKMFGFHWTISL